jgi:hypothetical protein
MFLHRGRGSRKLGTPITINHTDSNIGYTYTLGLNSRVPWWRRVWRYIQGLG